jgi:fumarylacetoacetate (FAA) hydrolase family protein
MPPTPCWWRGYGSLPWLLAPCDLQAIKAAGVTFVASMLERVIEEQARGDAAKAERCARRWSRSSATNLSAVRARLARRRRS